MFNKKGFTSIELTSYVIIAIILLLFLNILVKQGVYFKRNNDISLMQNISSLQQTLIKYQNISKCSTNEIILDDSNKILIKDQQLYMTPGLMPFIQNAKNIKFICNKHSIVLEVKYHEKNYQTTIFFTK